MHINIVRMCAWGAWA